MQCGAHTAGAQVISRIALVNSMGMTIKYDLINVIKRNGSNCDIGLTAWRSSWGLELYSGISVGRILWRPEMPVQNFRIIYSSVQIFRSGLSGGPTLSSQCHCRDWKGVKVRPWNCYKNPYLFLKVRAQCMAGPFISVLNWRKMWCAFERPESK